MMFDTMLDACHAWVREFNAIPSSVVEKLMDIDPYFTEITPPCMYDRVRIIFDEYAGEKGEIIETNANNTACYYRIRLDSGKEILKYADDIEVIDQEGWLPMHGVMWTFGDSLDEDWALGRYCESHLQDMADCGFRLYESEDFGLIFGIDGCGYNFYGTEDDPSHWLKLYKARGLKWHRNAEKETA